MEGQRAIEGGEGNEFWQWQIERQAALAIDTFRKGSGSILWLGVIGIGTANFL
jgi:hypothetical protein